MAITHVLAVAPVRDIERSVAWYERLFGRPADLRPMPGLADWHLAVGGWLHVFQDPERAGATLVNFAVEDLDKETAALGTDAVWCSARRSPAPAAPPGSPRSKTRTGTGSR
ncbi:VOC family protein [Yinghuangia aomiensis]